MSTNSIPVAANSLQFLKDKWFWLAMLAAPCVWAMMWWSFSMPVTFGETLSWLLLLTLVIAYPVLEEIVFRGALQGWLLGFKPLQAVVAGLSLANLATSVVFCGMHFFNQPPLWAALVFVPSLVFGWARERFLSIIPSIVLHVFYNAGFLLLFG